jgi:hypothetical protein
MKHASLTLKTRFQNFLPEAESNLQATSLRSKVTLTGSCFNEQTSFKEHKTAFYIKYEVDKCLNPVRKATYRNVQYENRVPVTLITYTRF